MKTLAEFKRLNKAAGNYFFDRKTMAFFNSRIESGLLGGMYFITSEQFEGSTGTGERKFTVRMCLTDGSVKTVGNFQAFRSKSDAKTFLSGIISSNKAVGFTPMEK